MIIVWKLRTLHRLLHHRGLFWVVKKSVPDRFFNHIDFLTKKSKKILFFSFFSFITRRNKLVHELATYKHLFCGKLGTSVSEKPWFLTENSDFLTRNPFFGTFELQQRYKSVWRTLFGENFYAESESGVKKCVLTLKKGQNLQKIVYFFCQSLDSQNKHYFLKLLNFFQKSKHIFWPRIWNQRKNLHQNRFSYAFITLL